VKLLTKRQTAVLDFITSYMEKHKHAPSRRELAKVFGVQVNGITGHLTALEKKGAISISKRKARGIHLKTYGSCPMCGCSSDVMDDVRLAMDTSLTRHGVRWREDIIDMAVQLLPTMLRRNA